MKLIAHRGLLYGPDKDLENNPAQIDLAISQGFDVEIDVWYINNTVYLGHDEPKYWVDLNFINRSSVWAHAKNYQALEYMLNNGVHCFWHENDERTLTSEGYVWTYPGKSTFEKSILVVLEKELSVPLNIFGVCGDYGIQWKETHCNLF